MSTPQDVCEPLVRQLGLAGGGENFHFGAYRQFPLSLTVSGSGDAVELQFHIRHLGAGDPGRSEFQFGGELRRLLAVKAAEITVENRGAWFRLSNAGELLRGQAVAGLLDEVLAELHRLGLKPAGATCLHCLTNPAGKPVIRSGRVDLICASCLAKETAPSIQDQEAAPAERPAPSSLGLTLWLGVLGIPAGAIAWAAIWILYDVLFGALQNADIWLPRMVTLAFLIIVSYALSRPIWLLITRVSFYGDRLTTVAAGLFAVVAVLFGDVLYATWLNYREAKIISLAGGTRLLLGLYLENSLFHLVTRLFAAGASVAIAFECARPTRVEERAIA